jgi:hypothetical protein
LFAPMRGVSTMLIKPICRPRRSKRSPSRGHSWYRGLIWLDLSKRRSRATHTYLSPWTSSRSG